MYNKSINSAIKIIVWSKKSMERRLLLELKLNESTWIFNEKHKAKKQEKVTLSNMGFM